MRYFFVFLLLVAGCASQTRDDYPSAWDDYDPADTQPAYDEDYVHPSRMGPERLLQRAREAEEQGRDDQARVDYHTLFRRDRWHPEGNERYQDLMLRNGLFDIVWQEYLDLWQENPERGDAVWYHLRPMLIEREDEPAMAEPEPPMSDEQREEIRRFLADADDAAAEGDRAGELAAIEKALAVSDAPELHVRRIDASPEDALGDLQEEYAAKFDENPASGDAAGLYGLALARTDADRSLEVLRQAWVLGLPGAWLRYAMGRLCHDRAKAADGPLDDLEVGELRRLRGWAMAAVRFLERVDGAPAGSVPSPMEAARGRLERIGSALDVELE